MKYMVEVPDDLPPGEIFMALAAQVEGIGTVAPWP